MKLLAAFTAAGLVAATRSSEVTYCLPGDACYPAEEVWSIFNSTVSGRLIKNVPYAAVCYEGTYDAEQCRQVIESRRIQQWRSANPGTLTS